MTELEKARQDYLTKLKKLALLDAGVSYNDVDLYVKYVNIDDEKEIENSAIEVANDINRKSETGDVYNQSADTWSFK